jgi:hypothetical protein
MSSKLSIYQASGQLAATMTGFGGLWSGYTAVFQPDGRYLWSVRMSGNGNTVPKSAAFDQAGRSAVSIQGSSSPLQIFQSNGQNVASIANNGSAFVASVSVFAFDGSYLWSVRIDGNGDDVATAVSFAPPGRLAVCGYFCRFKC